MMEENYNNREGYHGRIRKIRGTYGGRKQETNR
jgi:hypothetical protein